MIRLSRVTKCFGRVKAVDDLTLVIDPGEIVVVQGPSGSGKTTLLRLIAGLELPDAGEIVIDGQTVSTPARATAPHSRGIGIVFQRCALWPHMTVAQNIRFALDGLSKVESAQHLNALLARTALEDLSSRYPGQLSGGEARRVALARALAARPRRLLLDEPLTNLDPDLRGHLLQVIQSYVQQVGATLLYVTHDEAEARDVGGRWVRLERGRIGG
jgi:iron(III) transport system ATP-binding protein